MYSEVLDLIAAYECGMADVIRKRFADLGRQLTPDEVEQLFVDFESAAHWKPLIEKVRNKMAVATSLFGTHFIFTKGIHYAATKRRVRKVSWREEQGAR